jgi:hypothetical protein
MIESKTQQCVPAAFAMVMGTTMEALIERLGHDGKEVVVRDIPEPACFRSFHPQEFVDLLADDGYACTMYELNPCLQHGGSIINHAYYLGRDRFFEAMLRGDGVIFGRVNDSSVGHAVAWDSATNTIYDPRGYTYQWTDKPDFRPLQFFLVQKVQSCMTTSSKQNMDS